MRFAPLLFWVTRSAPHNRLTERRLRAIGHEAVTVPVLGIERVEPHAEIETPDAIAFTSAHGVAHHPFRDEWAGIPVFTVGDHTAAMARGAGYHDVRSARGDVTDLQKLIVTTLARPARLIHFGADQTAGDLCAYLEMSGYDSARQVVYRSRPVADADLGRAIGALPRLDGILAHSPKGARRIAELLAGQRWTGRVLCISQACADELRHLPSLQVATAARPTEDSLIHLVSLAGGARQRRRRLRAIPGGRVANDNRRWGPTLDGPDDPPPSAA